MAKEIYNEGRVVGLSAWEIFCRNVLEYNPNAEVPSEHDWLASSIGSGATMILKIPKGTSGWKEYTLPSESTLSAAGVIVASPFNGVCDFDGNWATRVRSYGNLIPNTSSSHPTDASMPDGVAEISSTIKTAFLEYVKISDGIVYHPGTWTRTKSANNPPYMDLTNPKFDSSNCIIRLYIEESLKSDVIVMLTGFTDKSVLSGISGLTSGSTDKTTNEWANGGMIGPAIFPWACKIVFTMPNVSYKEHQAERDRLAAQEYTRLFPADTTINKTKLGSYEIKLENSVDTTALVDLVSADPINFYNVNSSKYSKSVISQNSTKVTKGLKSGFSTLATWYPGMTAARINALDDNTSSDSYFFPPALYGISVTNTGKRNLVPIDTAAPGTVKIFDDADLAYKYTEQVPNNYAIYYNKSNKQSYFVIKGKPSVDDWTLMGSEFDETGLVKVFTDTNKAYQYITDNPSNAAIYHKNSTNQNFYVNPGKPNPQDWTLLGSDFDETGIVKAFTNPTEAYQYVQIYPDNFAIYHNNSNHKNYFVDKTTSVAANWDLLGSDVNFSVASEDIASGLGKMPVLKPFLNGKTYRTISLNDANGNAISLGDSRSSKYIIPEEQSGPYWGQLLYALYNNKQIDILGEKLRTFRTSLPDIPVGSNKIVFANATVQQVDATNTSDGTKEIKFSVAPKSGKNYITFNNGLRLYISNSAPSASGVPVGSIGIGW